MAKESVPTAYELLFQKLSEIAEIMEKNDKKTAVSVIKTRFPEFAGMSDNTIKTNITSFPFLCRNMQDVQGIRSELNVEKEANQKILRELDTVKKENTALQNELDKFRQILSNEKDRTQVIDNLEKENESLKIELDNFRQNLSKDKGMTQELDRVRKENELLSTELDNIRQDLDKDEDMDLTKEIQNLKSRVAAIETVVQENISQSLDNKLDRNVSNLDIPNFVDGWKVVFKEPYWKLYKTINEKLQWIHIGREFSEYKAKEKIRQKLAKLDSK